MLPFAQVFVVRKVAPCPDCSRRLAVSPNAGRSVSGPCAESLLPRSSFRCCSPSSSVACASRTTSTPRASCRRRPTRSSSSAPSSTTTSPSSGSPRPESVGGGGVIAAITKYESAAADLRIALKADGVPESVKANAQTPSPSARRSAPPRRRAGSPTSSSTSPATSRPCMSTAVSDLGLSDDSASAKIVVALQDTIAAQRAMTGEQLNLANTDDACRQPARHRPGRRRDRRPHATAVDRARPTRSARSASSSTRTAAAATPSSRQPPTRPRSRASAPSSSPATPATPS